MKQAKFDYVTAMTATSGAGVNEQNLISLHRVLFSAVFLYDWLYSNVRTLLIVNYWISAC